MGLYLFLIYVITMINVVINIGYEYHNQYHHLRQVTLPSHHQVTEYISFLWFFYV